ncbi:MAG: InlB B-repeat-containing protein, partial [Sphaerochaetaceae bacterium]|nr:InlB B-repeat-containing protein [Sphaerochaetaceae bacterium]
LTSEEESALTEARKVLQRVTEILDGIEDFDEALGNRGDPKGLVETVYERSLVTSDGFQSGRLRCNYDKETGDFYWMLSGYMQEQDLYSGTTGTGMNPGLQNVMLSDSITKLKSGSHTVEIYKEDGTRRTKKELEGEGIKLAISWLKENEIDDWYYRGMVGLVIDCQLIGETSDGTEFERTYTFRFVDGGVHLFDPDYRYIVVDGEVQPDLTDYYVLTYIAGDNGSITGETKQPVKPGEYGEAVTAVPDVGYHFVKWSDGSIDNPRTDKNVTGNITVTAVFAINEYDEYTVTFVDWDGSVIETQSVEHGKAATAPEDPERTGYTFSEWDKDFTNITGNLTVTAQYEINSYTVSFENADEVESQQIDHGNKAQKPEDPIKEGYSFIGWYADEALTVEFDFDTEITVDTTIYAKWEINTYTLTYTAGKDGNISGDATQTVEHGEDGTQVEAIPDEGYLFIKWSDDSTANPRTDTNIMADITVQAEFAINEYTVTFKDHEGNVIDTQTVKHGEGATAPDAPAREGYIFKGWDKEFTNVTSDLIITVQYTIGQCTVTFNSNGGSEVGAQTVDFGKIVAKPDNPIKEGYIFVGWYEEVELTNEWNFETGVVTEDITLYAKWKPKTGISYEVEHYQQDIAGDGYTLKEVEQLAGATDEAVNAEAKSYTGFTENTDHEDRLVSGTIKPDGSLVLKLYYDRDTFTVSFDSNDGFDVADIEGVRYEAKITEPEAPEKTGYIFGGWFKDEGLENKWNFESDQIIEGIILYARWTPNTNTVYTVEHHQQNPGTETYTLKDTDQKTGTTGEQTAAQAKDYTGFTAKEFSQVVIAADGNTVVKIYYERNSYILTYKITGDYFPD